jgi:hypothetical protein
MRSIPEFDPGWVKAHTYLPQVFAPLESISIFRIFCGSASLDGSVPQRPIQCIPKCYFYKLKIGEKNRRHHSVASMQQQCPFTISVSNVDPALKPLFGQNIL